jgi:hypothetical protein
LITLTECFTLFLKLGGMPCTAPQMLRQFGNFYEPINFSKELTPEFFYLPEFLMNSNTFNLGVRQNGVPVNDVTLPYP